MASRSLADGIVDVAGGLVASLLEETLPSPALQRHVQRTGRYFHNYILQTPAISMHAAPIKLCAALLEKRRSGRDASVTMESAFYDASSRRHCQGPERHTPESKIQACRGEIPQHIRQNSKVFQTRVE